MAHEFRKHEYLSFADIERCPFVFGTLECGEWNRQKDARDEITALERYAKSLICDHLIVKLESETGMYQMCMECGRTVCIYHDGTRMGDVW